MSVEPNGPAPSGLPPAWREEPTNLAISPDDLRKLQRLRLATQKLMLRIQDELNQLNLQQRLIGERALRSLGLDPMAEDYTIQEATGRVFRLVKAAPPTPDASMPDATKVD